MTLAFLWYKVVHIIPGQTVTCLHTISPGHIWTTLYNALKHSGGHSLIGAGSLRKKSSACSSWFLYGDPGSHRLFYGCVQTFTKWIAYFYL
jgi:hypothetical protein